MAGASASLLSGTGARAEAVRELTMIAAERDMALVVGARDVEHNIAVALRAY
jgi:hypothetical protein